MPKIISQPRSKPGSRSGTPGVPQTIENQPQIKNVYADKKRETEQKKPFCQNKSDSQNKADDKEVVKNFKNVKNIPAEKTVIQPEFAKSPEPTEAKIHVVKRKDVKPSNSSKPVKKSVSETLPDMGFQNFGKLQRSTSFCDLSIDATPSIDIPKFSSQEEVELFIAKLFSENEALKSELRIIQSQVQEMFLYNFKR